MVGTQNLSQSFSKINIGSPITSKKVTPQSPEFVPASRSSAVGSASASPNFFNSFPGLAGTAAAAAAAAVVPGYSRAALVDSPHSSTASPRITPQPSPPPSSHALNNCSPTSFGSTEKPTTYQVSGQQNTSSAGIKVGSNTIIVRVKVGREKTQLL